MVYVLYGSDNFSLQERLNKLRSELGQGEMGLLNTQVIDGSSVSTETFASACQSAPFMSTKRLVIVEGLMGRFAPPQSSATRRSSSNAAKTAKLKLNTAASQPGQQEQISSPGSVEYRDKVKQKKSDWLPFVDIINNLPESTVLILVDGELKEGNTFLKSLSDRFQPEKFPPLKEPELSMWVEKSASKYGARLSPEVIKELIELIGSNLWVMDSELQKLSLYSDDGKVTMSHVDELVSYSRENNIFQLIDAILFRRLKKAQQLLRQLMNGGAESVYILFMLTREIRRMLLAKLASSGKILPVELARELKLLESNDLRIAAAKSRRYAMATLSEFYHRILKTDINIKTGKLSSQFALELLIAEICSESPSG